MHWIGWEVESTSLDMASGYWQIPVAEKDEAKTAFITPDGV